MSMILYRITISSDSRSTLHLYPPTPKLVLERFIVDFFVIVVIAIELLALYLAFGVIAVVFEFHLGFPPGLWGGYVRKVATYRRKSARAFVMFAWPICLAIFIVTLPLEGILGIIRFINEPEEVEEPPKPSPVVEIATKQPDKYFPRNRVL